MTSIEILQQAKKQKRITLKEISQKSGVSLGTVNKLFSGGIKSIKTDTYDKIASVLGVGGVVKNELVACEQAGGEPLLSQNACGVEQNDLQKISATDYGFVRCAAYSGEIKVADVNGNVENIIKYIIEADEAGVSLAVFAELCITSYTAGDLLLQNTLLTAAENGLLKIAKSTVGREILVIVGLPMRVLGKTYNCAAAVCKGEVLGIVPKVNVPNYNEFYEKRLFCEGERAVKYINLFGKSVPFGANIIFENRENADMRVACEICEDIWVPNSPSISHSLAGATIIANLSASNECAGKTDYRRAMVAMASSKQLCAYIYASCGNGESTGDVVFGGHDMIYEAGRKLAECLPFEKGKVTADVDCSFLQFERGKKFRSQNEAEGYVTVNFSVKRKISLKREFSKTPFVPTENERLVSRVQEVFAIQTAGLAKRVRHVCAKKLVIGVSGGLDSTLALLVCVEALKKLGRPASDVLAVTMPCFGTSARTKNNAVVLAEALGCELKEINIKNSVLSHFNDIGQSADVTDVTYENAQARERTQVLMDLANKTGGLVVGTGDMSELALGWCTYGGDHLSMYGVNAGVPKTLIQKMVVVLGAPYNKTVQAALLDIAKTPISPELTPAKGGVIAQKTEDIVGPYELHDFFLYYFVKHGFSPAKVYYLARRTFIDCEPEVLQKWLYNFVNRFFSQQFKRSCLPEGPKTGALCLSPRGDWRMPSDAVKTLWIDDLNVAVEAEKNDGVI